MNSRMVGIVVLGSMATLIGCEDPRMVPVAPPGIEIQRVAPPTSGSGAEALGEAAGGANQAPIVSTLISPPTKVGESKKTSSGLVYETLKEGTGAEVKPGQTVTVNYIGSLTDGTKFDASLDHGGPSKMVIGRGKVIKGWDEGIPGMKVGEKRRLVVPADLGYGSSQNGPIPANSTLVFEVDILDIVDAN
jgi:FKBP-type peptidyl-prolyl cis-trans isomerase